MSLNTIASPAAREPGPLVTPPQHQHPAQPVPDRRQHFLQRGSFRGPVQQLANRSALPPRPRRASDLGPTQPTGRRTTIIAHMPVGNQQVPDLARSRRPKRKRGEPPASRLGLNDDQVIAARMLYHSPF